MFRRLLLVIPLAFVAGAGKALWDWTHAALTGKSDQAHHIASMSVVLIVLLVAVTFVTLPTESVRVLTAGYDPAQGATGHGD